MNPADSKKPGFFWQGLLIVLPAILLAVAGLWSLRQDRVLARHDAVEVAGRIAFDLAQVRLPQALRAVYSSDEREPDLVPSPGQPLNDPILQYAREKTPRIACLLDDSGKLHYPPVAPSQTPAPPVELSGLDAPRKALWIEAEQAEFVEENYNTAIAKYHQFLDGAPARYSTALAAYRLGVLMVKQGQEEPARGQFEMVLKRFPTATTQAGSLLSIYAALQLLHLTNDAPAIAAQRAERVDSVCALLVWNCPDMAEFIFDDPNFLKSVTAQAAAEWRAVLAAHQNARLLYHLYCEGFSDAHTMTNREAGGRWLEFLDHHSWVASAEPKGKQRWVFAISEADIRKIVDEVVAAQSAPAYFKVGVVIAGKSLTTPPRDAEEIAVASAKSLGTSAAEPEAAPPDLAVQVYLTDPSALFARQRARTLWFGSLMVLSALAVLVGFVTARRAFRRQQELSEMKSNFVSSVSHELRAPIASVRLMAEELTEIGSEDSRKNRSYHQFIVQECRRLSALIENVLDFSRHEEGRKQYEFEPTDLTALVEATIKLMQTYSAEKQIAVVGAIQGEPVEIEADGRAIQQVLVNLIDNAIKHSPSGSTVTVGLDFPGAASDKIPPSRHVTLCLWVEDQGAGIPIEDQKQIFERFYRRGSELRRETQGVGLGLAIVKNVTEAHGGRVTVRSALGEGCRFTVELPFQPPPKKTRKFMA